MSRFDQQDLVEIHSPESRGSGWCAATTDLADERARKRDVQLAVTEKQLHKIAAATRREKRPLRGRDTIALRSARWPVAQS